jgi:hypothetical protein
MDNKNYHVQYLDVTSQYWNPREGYAGGDHLLTALQNGWEIVECTEEQMWYAGARCVSIYHFKLQRKGETMIMPVINNPYVQRFIIQSQLPVKRKTTSAAADKQASA